MNLKPLPTGIKVPMGEQPDVPEDQDCELTKDRLTLTLEEFCKTTGLGLTKTHQILNEPESGLERIKVGRRTLISVSSLKAFLSRSAERKGS